MKKKEPKPDVRSKRIQLDLFQISIHIFDKTRFAAILWHENDMIANIGRNSLRELFSEIRFQIVAWSNPGTEIARNKILGLPHKHTVRKGETLSGIALKYNTPIKDILNTNAIEDPDLIFVGQRIKI